MPSILLRPFQAHYSMSLNIIQQNEWKINLLSIFFFSVQIGFHCVTNPKLGEELEQEAKHKVLTFMLGKKEDIRTTRYLPTVCRPNVEQVDSMFT
jgi:hypothetical protein